MQFRLFRIPIRVSPFFLLIAAYIGYVNRPAAVDDIVALVVTIPIVFFAVLAHELGHAFAGRSFGLEPQIELHGFGGLTSWRGQGRALTPWRSIFVSFAGPLVGIALGVPALAWSLAATPDDPLVDFTLTMFVFVNLGWGILNLIPMMPLDGGNIMASFFELFAKGKGRIAARWVSLALSAAILAWALATMNIWILVLVGFMAYSNFRSLQAERQLADDMPLIDELRDVQKALERGDADEVIRRAQALRAKATTPIVRAELQNMLAWGMYLRGDVDLARAALEETPKGRDPDPALYGAILLDLGHADEAIPPLEAALARTGAAFVDEKLARALITTRKFDRAVAIYSSSLGDKASSEAITSVRDAARASGNEEAATRLDALLTVKTPRPPA
jgi:Zn-dependent protease